MAVTSLRWRRFNALVVFFSLAVVVAGSVSVHAQSDERRLERARDAIASQRYESAIEELKRLVRRARGETLQESLFLFAGLQREGSDAQRMYRDAIDVEPGSEWALRSQLELAKVEYALGNYGRSYRMLSNSRGCEISEEACLFEGLAAIHVGRYEEARRPLTRIRRGKLRTWAYLSLAEVAAGMDRHEEACRRYESLAGTMISPTAVYRHGECLEDAGDTRGAVDEFRSIIANFPDTPEAVLASEKLQRIRSPARADFSPPEVATTTDSEPPLERGFTIQFGSFRDRANAIKLSAKIKRVFPGVRIDSELVRYREHHRVRYGYYRTREEAEAKAEDISREMNEDYAIMSIP